MHIPFVDLKTQYQNIKPEIDAAIANVISETAFIGGKHVEAFEKSFAELYGVKHCISCANGTDSLYIIMKMLGIGAGDEVITAANSWISSSETITQTGARAVFADIDPATFLMNINSIEQRITPATKAIMPVHLYGQMIDVAQLKTLCEKHNLYLIEDCAQSHFSEYNGVRAGITGIAGSFSFYPGKNLGAYGDAGCIITNDDNLALKCRMYARHGALKKHQHKMEGINSRLDGLQAAILSVKLPYILDWTERRIQAAARYNQLLQSITEIELPQNKAASKHTYHLYVIKAENRDDLAQHLKEVGIETAIHYPTPMPFMEAYQYLNATPEDYPVAYVNASIILSIPIFPEITENQQAYVAKQIKTFYN
jgi:dTDP-4-amino-4,6-dideoxygalactose transaminase